MRTFDDVPRDEIVHRGARFGSGARHVRHQHDVLLRQQPRMNLRLFLVHIEARALDDAFAQRPRQRVFVDDRAPRRVDQYADLFIRDSAVRSIRCRVCGDSGTWSEMTSDVARSWSNDMLS